MQSTHARFRAVAMVAPQPQLAFSQPTAVSEKDPSLVVFSPPKLRLEEASAPVPAGWQHPQITRLGLYHPLEVGHASVAREALPSVLARLRNVFRSLSLRTIYHDTPLAASCQSLEQVELRVSLWESRTDPNQVVLEVQRRCGDSVAFGGYARRILDSIGQESCQGVDRQVCLDSLWRAESCMRRIPVPPHVDPVQQALEVAHDLSIAERRDARQLGLESLCIMTDASKTGMPVAIPTAKCVLLGTSSDGNDQPMFRRVQERVVYLACSPAAPDAIGEDYMEEDEECFDRDDPEAYLALVALANAVEVLAQTESDATVFTGLLNETRRVANCDLLDYLVDQVHKAASCPHRAYFGTKALVGLCQKLPHARANVPLDVVKEAQHVGQDCHAALASEADRLYEMLS